MKEKKQKRQKKKKKQKEKKKRGPKRGTYPPRRPKKMIFLHKSLVRKS